MTKIAESYYNNKPGGILISAIRHEHGENLIEALQDRGITAEAFHGELDGDTRRGRLERFSNGTLRVMVASSIIDEGIDMKSIGCLVLASGGKSMRQTLQRIGRSLRLNGIDGNRVLIFDFYDQTNKLLLNHSKARLKIYEEEKFEVKQIGKNKK
jgi:superfamily II DNA or RNA helicase